MFTIQHKAHDEDPYGVLIDKFVARQFPAMMRMKSADVLDLVTDEFVGTGQHRYGPKPNPEQLVSMRAIMRLYMDENRPIPVVSPWGSEKPNGTIIDVAELTAMKQLMCLHERVAQFYPPGMEFSLRIEDLSAPHQFYHRADAAREEAKLYTDGIVQLLKVLGVNDVIHATPDSSYGFSEKVFNDMADSYLPVLEEHLAFPDSKEALASLAQIGWDKPVAPETRAHYLEGYKKLYPDADMKTKFHILARYFAGALVRKRLKMTGALPQWNNGFLELYFGKTPPGLVPSRYSKRIHYRTAPSSMTTNHMAPWRAKGYFLVRGDEVIPKLASFQDVLPLNQHSIELENVLGQKVEVQTDYIVE